MKTECEIAQEYIVDKNHSLTELSKHTGISLATLNVYRANPEKLETAAWIRVHEIAEQAKQN